MAKRENFAADRVAKLRCEPGKQQTIHWDGKTPGLGLRITAADARAYIFETRLHGKTLRLTVGDARTWTVGKAQDEATRLKAMCDQGIDPRQVKADLATAATEKRKEAARHDLTVADAWSAYVEARRPKWSARHLADHQNIAHPGGDWVVKRKRMTEPGALATLMPLKLAEVDTERVKAWLRDEAARRPTQAALAFRLLRAFLNWCADTPDYHGIAGADACQARIAKNTLPKKAAKTDCLQREQLPGWFAAVRAIGNPVIAAFLQTLLLIGSRREELAGLKWDDVDFRWQALTIRDKVEGQRTIPLTPYVASLLAALPRRNEWVFSSPLAKSGRLMEPSVQHHKACAVAGIEGMTLHGLRRSFGTLTEWVECPAGVVAQLMGHKPSATAEKHYKVRPLDLLRSWHVKIEAWILGQAGIEQPAEGQAGLQVVKAG
ncbi:MAG TPA: integrase family protein [Rhodocyclaceae bacterium]|nr:integrase family protein [Rhodocyclaceae bacterium]